VLTGGTNDETDVFTPLTIEGMKHRKLATQTTTGKDITDNYSTAIIT
jgi:hypothetical protein